MFVHSEVVAGSSYQMKQTLIKNKWENRIAADHFLCGDMSLWREQQQPCKHHSNTINKAVAQSLMYENSGVYCIGQYSSPQHVNGIKTT